MLTTPPKQYHARSTVQRPDAPRRSPVPGQGRRRQRVQAVSDVSKFDRDDRTRVPHAGVCNPKASHEACAFGGGVPVRLELGAGA